MSSVSSDGTTGTDWREVERCGRHETTGDDKRAEETDLKIGRHEELRQGFESVVRRATRLSSRRSVLRVLLGLNRANDLSQLLSVVGVVSPVVSGHDSEESFARQKRLTDVLPLVAKMAESRQIEGKGRLRALAARVVRRQHRRDVTSYFGINCWQTSRVRKRRPTPPNNDNRRHATTDDDATPKQVSPEPRAGDRRQPTTTDDRPTQR